MEAVRAHFGWGMPAGLIGFAQAWAPRLADQGASINAVAPGWIASSGMDSYDEDYRAVLRELRTKVPLQRFDQVR